MAVGLLFLAFVVLCVGVLAAFAVWLVLHFFKTAPRRPPLDDALDLLEQAQDAALRLSPEDRERLARWLQGLQARRPSGPSDGIRQGP
jgi:hypothetical protein